MSSANQPTDQPTNPSAVLIAHDRWANAQLYAACQSLSDEQFVQSFEMGTGSIHNNLVHNLGAMRGWTDVLDETPSRPRLEERIEDQPYTLDEIEKLHGEITKDFERAALARPFETVINRERGGQVYTFTVGGILTHVMTHSMHHRAQCLNMLRQLGVEGLPMSSVMEWMLMHD